MKDEDEDGDGEMGRAELLLHQLGAALVAPLIPHLFTKGYGFSGGRGIATSRSCPSRCSSPSRP